MVRRYSLLALVTIVLAAAGAASAASWVDEGSSAPVVWDADEIAAVVGDGILSTTDGDFRPSDVLTWGDLANALAVWGHPIAAPPDWAKPVTVRELDQRLVAALGLRRAAQAIRMGLRKAGLKPIASVGTETVARLVGLRINHPAAQDDLELLPDQPVTRAEAAYSFAHAFGVSDWQKTQVLNAALAFALPAVTSWQQTVLIRALRFVGYPYVWTGTSEKLIQTLWDGTIVPGGFDCSGFVWRVYKLQPFAGAPNLNGVLQGRTTYVMSGEVPPSERLPIEALQPADVVFFGSNGPASHPADIGHMGIYLGDGWFIHSSDHGVTLEPMTGWYQKRFAWARRPLAEAGLVPDPGVGPASAPAT